MVIIVVNINYSTVSSNIKLISNFARINLST
jgi:hypothetical protein